MIRTHDHHNGSTDTGIRYATSLPCVDRLGPPRAEMEAVVVELEDNPRSPNSASLCRGRASGERWSHKFHTTGPDA